MQAEKFVVPSRQLRQAVEYVYACDRTFQRIEQEAGQLTVRYWPPGFASLVRVIMGQQLSIKAAQAIFSRLNQLIELTPEALAECPDASLKQAGLSHAKIATCKRLAESILDEKLSLDGLASLPDELIVEQLIQIKGIGVWTAEIYLLFCLERLNSFPASDLALQKGYQHLHHLEQRPTRNELETMTHHLAPYRGAVAHLLWHYYRFLSVPSRNLSIDLCEYYSDMQMG